MLYSQAVRVCAMGILLAAITACGGGGGGGGKGGSSNPSVSLPDTDRATQKALTPDNSKQAVILALNAIGFIEGGAVPAPSSVDFYADSFSGTTGLSKTSQALRSRRLAAKTTDVSDQFCVSGSASVESGDNLIGVMTQRYKNCDLGDAVFDGQVKLDIRGYAFNDVLTDVTYTFRGLRVIAGAEDTIFDGTVVVKTSYPGAGSITADLDVRDVAANKGARVTGYRADFNIDYGSNYYGYYVYTVNRLQGRIYDEVGEYFDLGLTPGVAPWPMLVGQHSSLTLSPSGMSAPHQVKMALDADGDSKAEYFLLVDLGALSLTTDNNNAPEFHVDVASVRLEKDERYEVHFDDVIDADQQFVSVDWQLVEKPAGSDPIIDASADGFVFASTVSGEYHFLATASDGEYTATQELNIRVMYDVPQISANVPASMNADGTISFQVDVLNPEQGDVTVQPLSIPGLVYNGGTATFHPAIPDFGVDQQVNIGFVVANEDHRQTVVFPVNIMASSNASRPVMLASDYYYGYRSWVGQFTDDDSLEAVEQGYRFINLYEIEPGGKRYRESFNVDEVSDSSSFAILGISDLDGDGLDEIIYAIQQNYSSYLCVYDVKRHKILHKSLVESSGSSYTSYKLAVADLDGDGSQELSVLTSSGIQIFDRDLNMIWQSERGSFGSFLLATNFDGDASLELVTDAGFVLDGSTKTWQQRRGFYASGSSFVAIDTDNDGISEVFMIGERALQQMTQSGYVSYDVGAAILSNVIVQNVDGDAAPEMVFVTNHDVNNAQTPFPPYWTEGAVSLAYIDFAGAAPAVNLIRELQRGYYFSYLLHHADIDGDGDPEYLGLINNGGTAPASFVYHEDVDSQEYFGVNGFRLADTPKGGMAISSAGEKFVFCGGYAEGVNNYSRSDLYTFDLARMALGNELTSAINGQTSPLTGNMQCYTGKLEGSDKTYVISVGGDPYYSYYYQNSVVIKIQEAETGNAVLSLFKSLDTVITTSALGDIDGNHISDIVIAGGYKLIGLTTSQGDEIASYDFGSDSVQSIAVADVIAGNGKDEVIVRTSSQIKVLVYDGNGGFTVAAVSTGFGYYYNYQETRHLRVFDADGDGRNEIVVSNASDSVWNQFEVRVLNAQLQTIASWTDGGFMEDLMPYKWNDASTLIASLEWDGSESGEHLVWRDPMSGQLISRSTLLPQVQYGKLNLSYDMQASRLRAVVTGNNRIYITQ